MCHLAISIHYLYYAFGNISVVLSLNHIIDKDKSQSPGCCNFAMVLPLPPVTTPIGVTGVTVTMTV